MGGDTLMINDGDINGDGNYDIDELLEEIERLTAQCAVMFNKMVIAGETITALNKENYELRNRRD